MDEQADKMLELPGGNAGGLRSCCEGENLLYMFF